MSFRNGDKSRENRIRKARARMRLKIRKLQVKPEAAKKPASAGAPKK